MWQDILWDSLGPLFYFPTYLSHNRLGTNMIISSQDLTIIHLGMLGLYTAFWFLQRDIMIWANFTKQKTWNHICMSWCFHTLQWRRNGHHGVSNHQPYGRLLNRLFGRRSKKTSKLRVTGLCAGNSPGPVNSPHKGPATRKMFPFDDVITTSSGWMSYYFHYKVWVEIKYLFQTSTVQHIVSLNL